MLLNFNEAYFGKNKLLKEAESCLDSLKVRVNDKDDIDILMGTPEFLRLKEILCEVFGLADLLLIGSMSYNSMIFTMPLYYSPTFPFSDIAKHKFVTKNKYGICFKKNVEMVLMINVDFAALRNDGMNFTGGELLATILHEVGHNFFVTEQKNSWLPFLNIHRHFLSLLVQATTNEESIQILIAYITTPFIRNNEAYKRNASNLSAFIEKIKDYKSAKIFSEIATKAYRVFLDYQSLFFLYRFFLVGPTRWLAQFTGYIALNLINLVTFGWVDTIFVGYDNEKFSDNFASSYGYASELSTALIKLEEFSYQSGSLTLRKVINADKTGLIGFAINLALVPSLFLNYALIDNHPEVEQRVLNQTKLLKAELKKTNLKDETKQKILQDLENMEKIEKEYFYGSTKGDNPIIKLKKSLRKYKKAVGGDIRELIRGTAGDDFKDWEQLEV